MHHLKSIRKKFFSKKVYLFDLDGTLYLGKKPLAGALALLSKLRKQNKKIFFFTNNSSRSENDYLLKLKAMGFEVSRNEVVMSTHTLIRYLQKKKWNKIYLLGTPAMKKMLSSAGIHLQSKRQKPQAVVVGFDKTLTYEKLRDACRWVAKGVPYIVTHPDLFCPTDEGPEPDCGAFAKAIELVTKKKPLVTLGKPHPSMMEEVKRRASHTKREMILIGDRLSTDIWMGNAFGIETLLVLSGETKRQDLKNHFHKKERPSMVIPSVASLL